MRTLFIGRSQDFAHRPYDGFVKRHTRLISVAAGLGEAVLLGLRAPGDASEVSPALAALRREELPMPLGPPTRLRTLLGPPRNPSWTARAADALATIAPDVVVTLGPWLDDEYVGVRQLTHTVHLLEEDVWSMPDLASQSIQGRTLRRVGSFVRRVRFSMPTHVVVISDQERRRAVRRHGRRRVQHHVLPQTLDESWRPCHVRSDGKELLCVGVLSESRNAEGLAQVLGSLDRFPRPPSFLVRLVSRSLHPLLQPYATLPWVVHDAQVDDPMPLYRAAHMALVPAARATGVKATILQAWQSGCPVAALSGSASTIATAHRRAVLEAPDGPSLAALVLDSWDDDLLLDDLVAQGIEAMRSTYADRRALDSWAALLTAVAQHHR